MIFWKVDFFDFIFKTSKNLSRFNYLVSSERAFQFRELNYRDRFLFRPFVREADLPEQRLGHAANPVQERTRKVRTLLKASKVRVFPATIKRMINREILVLGSERGRRKVLVFWSSWLTIKSVKLTNEHSHGRAFLLRSLDPFTF